MLFFELFPAFLMLVSLVVGVWLYASNQSAPDETAENEKRRREAEERAVSARSAHNAPRDPHTRRPSMTP